MPVKKKELADNIKYLGNYDLLKLHKTAFLCSRQIPAAAVLKCYDWAIEMREKKQCIISGFHSPLEKDVLNILINGEQPIIIAMAKRINKKIPQYFQKAYDENRLLIISGFDEKVIRASEKTATARNKLMLELADEIVIGYCSENGQLKKMLRNTNKQIEYLIK